MIGSIEHELQLWIQKKREARFPKTLIDAAEYALMSGGKRIRPRLVLASADALGIARERAMPLAIAIEIYHTFSLVHDDLPGMDNDDLRRGNPTVHRIFGDAQAILVGDFLLQESLSMFYRTSESHQLRDLVDFSTGGFGVIGGQSIEFEGTHPLEQIHDQKTAALFRLSIASPVYLEPTIVPQFAQKLLQLGTDIGLAFQIADDLEDRTSNTASAQKSKSNHKKMFENYDQWFQDPIWPGNSSELRTACREVSNKLDSA